MAVHVRIILAFTRASPNTSTGLGRIRRMAASAKTSERIAANFMAAAAAAAAVIL